MDPNLVALLVSVFLAILASVFGTKYYHVKGKASQINAFIKTGEWEPEPCQMEKPPSRHKLIFKVTLKT